MKTIDLRTKINEVNIFLNVWHNLPKWRTEEEGAGADAELMIRSKWMEKNFCGIFGTTFANGNDYKLEAVYIHESSNDEIKFLKSVWFVNGEAVIVNGGRMIEIPCDWGGEKTKELRLRVSKSDHTEIYAEIPVLKAGDKFEIHYRGTRAYLFSTRKGTGAYTFELGKDELEEKL